jgi:putative hemolysin
MILSFILVLLLLASAFCSASETALFSLSSMQLNHYRRSKNLRQALVAHLMEKPRDVLVTILILNVLANILVQNTVSSLFEKTNGWGWKVGLPLALTLIFGELLPKSLALPNNATMSGFAAPWISKCSRWLGPLRNHLTRMTNWISRFFFLILQEDKEISAEELKHVLKTSEKRGVLFKQESQMIGGALDLQEVPVSVIMRPREEILSYDLQEPMSSLLTLFAEQQITRIPVCDKDLDNIKGILSASAFFLEEPNIRESHGLLPLLEKPYYVPETTKAFTAFKGMRSKGATLAIVVDEYGTISGLISQEDLIEKVVGEISDKRDTSSLYTRSGQDVIIANGKLELAEFQDIFGIPLVSKEHAVTIGGWLIEQLGSIPQTGTQYATDDFLFYVLAAEPNRVQRIYVRRLGGP